MFSMNLAPVRTSSFFLPGWTYTFLWNKMDPDTTSTGDGERARGKDGDISTDNGNKTGV